MQKVRKEKNLTPYLSALRNIHKEMKTAKDPRHQTRRLALCLVYSQTNSDDPHFEKIDVASVKSTVQDLEITQYDKQFLHAIIDGIAEHYSELLAVIQKHSNDWDLDKMYKVDVSTLLVAIWEILYSDAPQKVVVDEAVELAKEFGESESAKFVNGILSGVLNEYANP